MTDILDLVDGMYRFMLNGGKEQSRSALVSGGRRNVDISIDMSLLCMADSLSSKTKSKPIFGWPYHRLQIHKGISRHCHPLCFELCFMFPL